MSEHPRGLRETLSRELRHLVVDRILDAEDSLRATLTAVQHGTELVRLLRDVGLRFGDHELLHWCDDLLVSRDHIDRTERALAWFTEEPRRAPPSSLVLALCSAE